jgi:hypothetical protein
VRDIHRIPLRRLRKRELRELVVEMRWQHEREINTLLMQVPVEASVDWLMERARKGTT